MSRERVGKKIKLNGYEDLFNSSEEQTEKEQIKELSLSELHTFKNHPFKIFDDEKRYFIFKYFYFFPIIFR